MTLDRKEFEQALIQEIPTLRAYAHSLCTGDRRSVDADELLQETFVRALRAWRTFTPGTLRGWLMTIMKNQWNDCWHQVRRHQTISDAVRERVIDLFGMRDRTIGPPQRIQVEFKETLNLVERLPAGQRAAILAVHLRELTYEEYAAEARIPINTVRSRIHRGIAALERMRDPPPPKRRSFFRQA